MKQEARPAACAVLSTAMLGLRVDQQAVRVPCVKQHTQLIQSAASRDADVLLMSRGSGKALSPPQLPEHCSAAARGLAHGRLFPERTLLVLSSLGHDCWSGVWFWCFGEHVTGQAPARRGLPPAWAACGSRRVLCSFHYVC